VEVDWAAKEHLELLAVVDMRRCGSFKGERVQQLAPLFDKLLVLVP
jgi:hypothetical protein